MAGGADRRTFVLALTGAGLGALLLRFPVGDGVASGWTWAVALASAALLGLPLVLGEAALGQFRRRNAVSAFGPGAWAGVGGFLAVGAVLAAALAAVVAGWAARWFLDSFASSWFGDPARQERLVEAGPDALLAALAVLAAATALAFRALSRGLRGAVSACGVASLVLLAALAAYGNLQSGSAAGREALFRFGAHGLDASSVVAAVLAGLLPALLATGAAATLAARVQDRTLPRETVVVVLFVGTGLFLALLALAGLSGANGHAFDASGAIQVRAVPAVLVAAGGAEGGILLGTFAAAVLLGALALLAVLLEVPAAWLAERFGSWTPGRGALASGLAAYLVAVPFCFGAVRAERLDGLLAWVAAPLAGLLVSVRVGWSRPEVLDGFRIGDARHPLDKVLAPALRYVMPPVLLLLLLAGCLGFARAAGWADGSGGLWSLAP
jgi:SNF family Na+-dependent transporter